MRTASHLGLAGLALSTCAAWAGAAGAPVVVFDEAHGQRFRAGASGPLDLSGLAAVATATGGSVQASREPLTAGRLAPVSLLVVSGPFAPPSEAEIDAAVRWVEQGGSLLVLLHIEPTLRDLLHRFGVSVSNGVIRETEGLLANEPLNFRVTRLEAHPVTSGLTSFAVYGAWALLPTGEGLTVLGKTSPTSWVDLDRDSRLGARDARQSFAVALAGLRGQGRLAVFGDDALFQNQYLQGANRTLAEQLMAWLLEPGRAGQRAAAAQLSAARRSSSR
jgi:hypothetical protein